jgi:hypothetical protein
MSGTEEAFHLTKEDVRKPESKESQRHGGNVPAGSEAAGLQVVQHISRSIDANID